MISNTFISWCNYSAKIFTLGIDIFSFVYKQFIQVIVFYRYTQSTSEIMKHEFFSSVGSLFGWSALFILLLPLWTFSGFSVSDTTPLQASSILPLLYLQYLDQSQKSYFFSSLFKFWSRGALYRLQVSKLFLSPEPGV